MSLKFFNLHSHTGFSLYDGYAAPDDHIQWMLKNAGEDSGGLAITEHGTMNSIGYIAAAQKKYKTQGAPVKILYGMEAYFIPSLSDWRQLKNESDEEKERIKLEKKKGKAKVEDDTKDEEGLVFENEKESKSKIFNPINRRNHLVLVAYSAAGLKNLYRLVSRSHRDGFYRKPRIDLEMLDKCNEGLIASSACLAGIGSYYSMQHESQEEVFKGCNKDLLPIMQMFGKERFFLELQFNNIPEQQKANKDIYDYAAKTGYSLIATADAHFPRPEDWKAREMYRMLGFQMKKQEIDKSIIEMEAKDLDAHLYLKNGDQMFESFKNSEFSKFADHDIIKQAIERSYHVAHDFCNHVFPDSTTKIPKITGGNISSFDLLQKLALEGLKRKGLHDKKEYVDRLIYELKIIKKLNLADYFTTLQEMIKTLKKNMLIGDGRGSGCGSLLNYVLEITFIDPIKEGLIFERFLSAAKGEADVDNDVELREESLEILKERFGKDNVIAITNYNRLQLKSIIKDLSKLFDVDFNEVNKVTMVVEKEAREDILKEVNNDQKLYELTYERALKYSPTFNDFIEKYPIVGSHIESLYQEIRSLGKHAGGILVVPDAEANIPIIRIKDVDQCPITEGITAQHTKFFGLIKYDILGLTTLKIIRGCIENILKESTTIKPTMVDVWRFYDENLASNVIKPDDTKVFSSVYWKGRFPSIFQFEESGVQKFTMQALPGSVQDLAALTSLWRPGPLQGSADQKYLNFNADELKLEHPVIQRTLGDTRGLILYQEQFMQMANELGGFSLDESDQLRKLLVKPSQELGPELLVKRREYREKFINGCVNSGLSIERATILWDEEILGFISYGFNKSHAIAYAYTSYRCAWLFTYYPTEWLKACLECDPDLDKTIKVMRGMGYSVSKVNVNHSHATEWSFVNGEWLPPLNSLKGLGEVGANELLNQRLVSGFADLQSFFFNEYGNWRWSKFNKKCIEALLKTDSFDDLIKTSGFKNGRHLMLFLEEYADKVKKGKITLNQCDLIEDDRDFTLSEKIVFQKEIIGFYDKEMVMKKYIKTLNDFNIPSIDDEEEDFSKPKIWAIVEDVEKISKNGKDSFKITVSGRSNKPYTFKAWTDQLQVDANWAVGNVLIFGLDYHPQWGYNLSKKTKVFKVTR